MHTNRYSRKKQHIKTMQKKFAGVGYKSWNDFACHQDDHRYWRCMDSAGTRWEESEGRLRAMYRGWISSDEPDVFVLKNSDYKMY